MIVRSQIQLIKIEGMNIFTAKFRPKRDSNSVLGNACSALPDELSGYLGVGQRQYSTWAHDEPA